MDKIEAVWWFVFSKDQLLLEKQNGSLVLPCSTEAPVTPPRGATIHQIATLDNLPCKAFALDGDVEETNLHVAMSLRMAYDALPLSQYNLAGKAFEILHWDHNSRFCSVCGSTMKQQEPIMKKCPVCGTEMYPNISAAILVLVCKDDSILLVRALNFRGTHYGLVAGFLETGETLEECVRREVKEETGLDISNVTYFGNQPWPYPSGLMVGFIADYAGGEIKIQKEELSTAAFFHRDNLPELPRKLSLARKMIDWWIEQK